MNTHRTHILVLGGTGKTGRRVVERLRARDLPVRVGSRSGTPPFDWEDRSTWAPALDGVGSVYLSYCPDIAVPRAVDTVRAFAELAVRRGARRIGRLYELTGPDSLTFDDTAAILSAASGRPVRYVPVTLEQHADELRGHDVPEEVVELLTYLFAEVVDGRNADTTDGVREALGREPRDFDADAATAAATGVWAATPAAAR